MRRIEEIHTDMHSLTAGFYQDEHLVDGQYSYSRNDTSVQQILVEWFIHSISPMEVRIPDNDIHTLIKGNHI
jgi:hypothetical protein